MKETPLPSYRGFSEEELQAAFTLVQNSENWKRPINAVVEPTANLEAIRIAVTYFTGSVANMTPAKGGKVRVRARGYYAVIGS